MEAAGWRSVFFLIAAMSVPAWLCAAGAPESRDPGRPGFDWPGLVCFTSGLAAVSFALVQAGTAGWTASGTLVPLAGAIVLITAFAVAEIGKAERAMFDVRLCAKPAFVAVVCQPLTVTLGFVVLLVYLPAYLQGVGGRSVLDSGLFLLPLTAPVLLLPVPASRLAAHTSIRAVLTGASLLIAAGALLLTTVRGHGSWLASTPALLPFGLGVGLAFGVMDNAAVGTVPLESAGAAAGIFNTMRITGESVAVSAAGALLSTLTAARLTAGGLPASQAARIAGQAVQGHVETAYQSRLDAGFTDAFHTVGLVLAALSALGAALTYLALRGTDDGRRPRRRSRGWTRPRRSAARTR